MKTPDTTEVMSSAHDSADFIELAKVFNMSTALIRALNDLYPDHVEWDAVLEMIGREMAQIEGYPHTEKDQQPFDIPRTFPLSLSPDMYDTLEDYEVAKRLYWLWAGSIVHHCTGKEIDTINRVIWGINVRLVYLFTNRTKEAVLRLIDAVQWINELRIQHGLHNMSTGQLIDRDEYTLRKLLLDLSGASDEGRIITGDSLDTTNIKATLFDGGDA